MFSKLASKFFVTLVIVLGASSASAGLMDIRFTASGSATGTGVLTLDSTLIVPGKRICCTAVPAGFKNLDLSLNFGQGNTFFDLGDLSGTSFILAFNPSGVITDLNFWGRNDAGVTLWGTSPFRGFASGAMGANGTVTYTVNAIAPASQVPEPVSLALLGLGVAGMAAARRRRK